MHLLMLSTMAWVGHACKVCPGGKEECMGHKTVHELCPHTLQVNFLKIVEPKMKPKIAQSVL